MLWGDGKIDEHLFVNAAAVRDKKGLNHHLRFFFGTNMCCGPSNTYAWSRGRRDSGTFEHVSQREYIICTKYCLYLL